jgi:battenin
MLGGYALIAIVCNFTSIVAFVFSLVASIILGINLSFGESTNLGYLKGFPKRLVVGYSSGTGFAGVFGAGIPVLLQSQGITLFWVQK